MAAQEIVGQIQMGIWFANNFYFLSNDKISERRIVIARRAVRPSAAISRPKKTQLLN